MYTELYLQNKYPKNSSISGTIFMIAQFGYLIKIDGENEKVVALVHKGQYILDFKLVEGDRVRGIVSGCHGSEVIITNVKKI